MRTLITIAGTLLAGATPFAASAALRPEAVTVANPGHQAEDAFAIYSANLLAPQDRERSEIEELRRAVEELRAEKDRLRAEIEAERAGAGAGAGSTTPDESPQEAALRLYFEEAVKSAYPPSPDDLHFVTATWPDAALAEAAERKLAEEQRAREQYEGVLELKDRDGLLVDLERVQADLKSELERAASRGDDLDGLRHELARVQGEAIRVQSEKRALLAELHAAQAHAQAQEARERLESDLRDAQRDAERRAVEEDLWAEIVEDEDGSFRTWLRHEGAHESHGHAGHDVHEHEHGHDGHHFDFDVEFDVKEYEDLWFHEADGDDEADDEVRRIIVRTRDGDTERRFFPGAVTVETDGDGEDDFVWIEVDGERHGVYTGSDDAPSRSFIHDSDGVVIDVQRKVLVRGDDGQLIEIHAPEPPQAPDAPEAPRFFGVSGGTGSAPSATGGGRVLRVRKATAPQTSSGGGVARAPRASGRFGGVPRSGGGSTPPPARDDLLREVHDLTRAMLGELRELRAAVDELRRDVDARHGRSRGR